MATSPTTSSRQRSTREPAMGKRSRRPVSGRMVSASDLAQMGRCERLAVFEHLYGSRRTAQQQQARARGLVEHEQFYREGRAAVRAGRSEGALFHRHLRVRRGLADGGAAPVQGRGAATQRLGTPGDPPLLSGGPQHLRRPAPMARVASSCAHGLGGDSDRTSVVVRLAWRRQVSALAWGVGCAVAVVASRWPWRGGDHLRPMPHGLSGPHDRQRCGMPSWSTWKSCSGFPRPSDWWRNLTGHTACPPVCSCWWSSRLAGATSRACRM
jgi:hypothetical protein